MNVLKMMKQHENSIVVIMFNQNYMRDVSLKQFQKNVDRFIKTLTNDISEKVVIGLDGHTKSEETF